jgi:hypothetical protein
MPLRARIPSDPLIRLIFELNRTERPEWEGHIKRWMKKNGIELKENRESERGREYGRGTGEG